MLNTLMKWLTENPPSSTRAKLKAIIVSIIIIGIATLLFKEVNAVVSSDQPKLILVIMIEHPDGTHYYAEHPKPTEGICITSRNRIRWAWRNHTESILTKAECE